MQIHILSAPIQTGKTTSLLKYCEQHKNCSGILTPLKNGKRYFYSVTSGESKAMEADEMETDILEVGKYKFSQTGFNWAIEQIKLDASSTSNLLIIDEIGPLELKGKGFADVLNYLLSAELKVANLLLVIRESALKDVLAYFHIEKKNTQPWIVN